MKHIDKPAALPHQRVSGVQNTQECIIRTKLETLACGI
jgi:hypothetical protein